MKTPGLVRSLLVASALGAGLAPAALAGKRTPGEVVACSRYGNGCVRAAVRQGPFGLQMRVKGRSSWMDCRGDCEQALREDTVDLWETQNDKAMAVGP